MGRPRIRISTLMLLVVIAALVAALVVQERRIAKKREAELRETLAIIRVNAENYGRAYAEADRQMERAKSRLEKGQPGNDARNP
jgi:hypothetical protein